MGSITQLRRMVGLTADDERQIAAHRAVLLGAMAQWEPDLLQWFADHGLWGAGMRPPLQEGFLASFVGACYDEEFHGVQYRQALFWRRHGLEGGHAIACMSRLRQFFVGVAETEGDNSLARSLCRVVDVAQSVHALVYHLEHTLGRLKAAAEHDIARIRRSCESLIDADRDGAVRAYTDHHRWKVRAYSLALGEPVDERDLPMSPRECGLGRWLEAGGLEQIPEDSRSGFLAAHERLHRLVVFTLEEAKRQQPQRIVDYLLDIEAASEEIAEVLGGCIDRRMNQLAAEDSLTQLRNRRLFDKDFSHRIASSRRGHAGFGVLLVDLDHFKAVNDRFGHGVGDEVLKQVAARIVGILRSSDTLYRWGGEEFAALVCVDNLPELERAAERIRIGVGAAVMETRAGSIHVTVSVGGVFCEAGEELRTDTVFERADRNLYQAKSQGRNGAYVD